VRSLLLSAIELNYQMALLATEVSDERAERKLAAKSEAIKTSRAEMMPQDELRIGLLAPHLSRPHKLECDAARIGQQNLSLTLSLDKERGFRRRMHCSLVTLSNLLDRLLADCSPKTPLLVQGEGQGEVS
jgi:hypothetical protein